MTRFNSKALKSAKKRLDRANTTAVQQKDSGNKLLTEQSSQNKTMMNLHELQ
jgi:hypothetical protein